MNQLDSDVTLGLTGESIFQTKNLFSDITMLRGANIEFVKVIPAEVKRVVSKYLLMQVRKGKKVTRHILLVATVQRPCPSDIDMWDDLDFWLTEEIQARRMNKALELSPKKQRITVLEEVEDETT